MSAQVSEIFGFVLQHGSTAEEVLFAETPLPGMTEQEREAIASIEPHLRESWIGLLTACRSALWARSAGHPCAPAMQRPKVRPSTMYDRFSFHVVLVPGQATCGVTLDAWGEPRYHLFVWTWVDTRHLQAAEQAVEGLPLRRNDGGLFFLALDTPRVGERFDEIGERSAEQLWAFARPIAESVLAARGT